MAPHSRLAASGFGAVDDVVTGAGPGAGFDELFVSMVWF